MIATKAIPGPRAAAAAYLQAKKQMLTVEWPNSHQNQLFGPQEVYFGFPFVLQPLLLLHKVFFLAAVKITAVLGSKGEASQALFALSCLRFFAGK